MYCNRSKKSLSILLCLISPSSIPEAVKIESIGDFWHVHYHEDKIYKARNLCLASGAHNILRSLKLKSDSSVPVVDSNKIETFSDFDSKKSIAVVGGGPSALDVLDHLLGRNPNRKLYWFNRNPSYFSFNKGGKNQFEPLRQLALKLILDRKIENTNQFLNRYFEKKYSHGDFKDLKPGFDLDIREHVTPNSRLSLLENISKITVVRGEVIDKVESGAIYTSKKRHIPVDVIFNCCGYDMDLSYTSLTGLESLTKPKDLRLKTYGYCKSSDYDNLYFASMPYSDSNSTTPFIVNQPIVVS